MGLFDKILGGELEGLLNIGKDFINTAPKYAKEFGAKASEVASSFSERGGLNEIGRAAGGSTKQSRMSMLWDWGTNKAGFEAHNAKYAGRGNYNKSLGMYMGNNMLGGVIPDIAGIPSIKMGEEEAQSLLRAKNTALGRQVAVGAGALGVATVGAVGVGGASWTYRNLKGY